MSRTVVVHPEVLFEVEVRLKRKINPIKVWLRETVPVEVVLHDDSEIPVVAIMRDGREGRESPLMKHEGRFFISDGDALPADGIETSLAAHLTYRSDWQWRLAKEDLAEHGVVADIIDDSGRQKAKAEIRERVSSKVFVGNDDVGYRELENVREPVLVLKDIHHRGQYSAWIGVEFPNESKNYFSNRWPLDAEAEMRRSLRNLEKDGVSGLVAVLRPELLEYDHHRDKALDAFDSLMRTAKRWIGDNVETATVDEFAVWRSCVDVWSELKLGADITTDDIATFRSLGSAIEAKEGYDTLKNFDKSIRRTRYATSLQQLDAMPDTGTVDEDDPGVDFSL
jgi:hypothetical protein